VKTCPRCGWTRGPNAVYPPPEIHCWPPNMAPPPPLPTLTDPHPEDGCPSPLEIGDLVWWDLGGVAPDLPPVQGTFVGLDGFTGPVFALSSDNKWVLEHSAIKPHAAKIRLKPGSVLQEHLGVYDNLLEEDLVIRLDELTVVDRWPVLP